MTWSAWTYVSGPRPQAGQCGACKHIERANHLMESRSQFRCGLTKKRVYATKNAPAWCPVFFPKEEPGR